jgi:hypothetical protein
MSPACEQAYNDAVTYGHALLKFISANEVVYAQSHQMGYLIPMKAAALFTPYKFEKLVNRTHKVEVLWQNGQITNSNVKWYGNLTRREYRITRFGKHFPFAGNNPDLVGNLLVLIPKDISHFNGYVLHTEEDIEEILAALGIELLGTFGIYDKGTIQQPEKEDECIERRFIDFARDIEAMPSGRVFADLTRNVLEECIRHFKIKEFDVQLSTLLKQEYLLFKLVERKIYSPILTRPFRSIDDFVDQGLSILNSRKTRAGRSLENHVDFLLTQAGLPHAMRSAGMADVVFPSIKAYEDTSFPTRKLLTLALKTTCKDRWRQILPEARRVSVKHLLTLQQGISSKQIAEMKREGVQLVVPKPLHEKYPSDCQSDLMTLDSFVETAKALYL